MGSRRVDWIEAGVDTAAALLLALAAAFLLFNIPADPALRVALPALAFAGCFYGLRGIKPDAAFEVAEFEVGALRTIHADELVLTDADRLNCQELLLDREMAHIGPGSRVVQLFEPAAMPTPGELQARIDRHVAKVPNVHANAGEAHRQDESQALFEALAELRRSLR